MIPKVIHYCWFGGNPLPEFAENCIESWKKMCPNYEIIRWDETNFDFNCCKYTKEAYDAKKWAFVSDFARFKIIYEHGGIYLDTDVELIKDINEIVLKGPFFGEEGGGRKITVNPGLGMAAEAGNKIYKEILDYYLNESFIKQDDSLDFETIVAKVTTILRREGFRGTGMIENVGGITIYPPEFFCPKNYNTGELSLTENTYSIHHFSATWHEPEEAKGHMIETKLNRIFGITIGQVLGQITWKYFRVKYRIRVNNGIIGAAGYFYKKYKRKIGL